MNELLSEYGVGEAGESVGRFWESGGLSHGRRGSGIRAREQGKHDRLCARCDWMGRDEEKAVQTVRVRGSDGVPSAHGVPLARSDGGARVRRSRERQEGLVGEGMKDEFDMRIVPLVAAVAFETLLRRAQE